MLATQEGYRELVEVLEEAINQAVAGKGKDRHSSSETSEFIPFIEQKIFTITKSVGLGYPTGQAIKKIMESLTLLKKDKGKQRAIDELLGAINYVAAAIIVIKKMD